MNVLFCCPSKSAWQKKQLKGNETALGNKQYELLSVPHTLPPSLPKISASYCLHAKCNLKFSHFDRENNAERNMRRQESHNFNIVCNTGILHVP